VLGREVVEGEQHVEVLGDLRARLGPLRAVGSGERPRGGLGVLAVLGVVDLGEGGLGVLVQRGEHVADLVATSTTARESRETRRAAHARTPARRRRRRAPGRSCRRRLHERSSSAQDSVDSRCPSSRAISSFVPSARTPTMTSRHTLSWVKRTLRWIPSTHTYT